MRAIEPCHNVPINAVITRSYYPNGFTKADDLQFYRNWVEHMNSIRRIHLEYVPFT